VVRGEKIGMIKLGSHTEFMVPDRRDMRIEVNVGDRVRAGVTVRAKRGDQGSPRPRTASPESRE